MYNPTTKAVDAKATTRKILYTKSEFEFTFPFSIYDKLYPYIIQDVIKTNHILCPIFWIINRAINNNANPLFVAPI